MTAPVEPFSVAIVPDTETLDRVVGELVEVERQMATLAARRAAVLVSAAEWIDCVASTAVDEGTAPSGWNSATVARRTLSSEAAVALRISERTVQRWMHEAVTLATDLPQTLAALDAGDISYRHAQRILDNAEPLEPDDRRALDAFLHPKASTQSIAQLDRRAKTRIARLHPEALTTRRATAFENRRVCTTPDADGMGWLNVYLSAEALTGIDHRVTELARAVSNADDPRTIAQIRADVAADLLTSGEVDELPKGVTAKVMVTVPVLTLLGLEEEPATLEGWGPIDPEAARRLAAHAPSFTRVLTHPETGVVLSVGRESYRVPVDLKNWLRVRDETCRFPGCTASILTSEIDHTIDYHGPEEGPTDHDNLCFLCRVHHHLKHRTRWTVEQIDGGLFLWTSPGGREYEVRASPPWAA